MSNYTKYSVKENSNYTGEKFSDKMRLSKYKTRSQAIRNNTKLDDFLTELYYNYNKRQKLIEDVEKGLTGIESIRKDLINCFSYLSNSDKQGLGMAIAIILSESGFFPSKSVPIFNCINIKNAHLYARTY